MSIGMQYIQINERSSCVNIWGRGVQLEQQWCQSLHQNEVAIECSSDTEAGNKYLISPSLGRLQTDKQMDAFHLQPIKVYEGHFPCCN